MEATYPTPDKRNWARLARPGGLCVPVGISVSDVHYIESDQQDRTSDWVQYRQCCAIAIATKDGRALSRHQQNGLNRLLTQHFHEYEVVRDAVPNSAVRELHWRVERPVSIDLERAQRGRESDPYQLLNQRHRHRIRTLQDRLRYGIDANGGTVHCAPESASEGFARS